MNEMRLYRWDELFFWNECLDCTIGCIGHGIAEHYMDTKELVQTHWPLFLEKVMDSEKQGLEKAHCGTGDD